MPCTKGNYGKKYEALDNDVINTREDMKLPEDKAGMYNNARNSNVFGNETESLNGKLKKIGWWKASRNNDVIHLTRIINEPEFQDSRKKIELLKWYNTHGNNALHIACLSGSFQIVLTLLQAGADPLWKTLLTTRKR